MKSEVIVLSTRCSECDFVLVRKYTTGGWRPPLIKACGRGAEDRKTTNQSKRSTKREIGSDCLMKLCKPVLISGYQTSTKWALKKSTLETICY